MKYIDPDSKYEILVFNNNIVNEDIRNIRIKEEENFWNLHTKLIPLNTTLI